MKKDLDWFKARKGEDVIRMYKDNETRVTIQGGVANDYINYFFNLQDEGFSFRDTNETVAGQQFDS